MGLEYRLVIATLALLLAIPAESAQRRQHFAGNSEQRMAQQFASLGPSEKLAFLRQMPKGGDLDLHLSGTAYAESLISWAAGKGVCVDRPEMTLTAPPCDAANGATVVSEADPILYRRMLDFWSIRDPANSRGRAHDRFFDAFGKFSLAQSGMNGQMLADAAARAAANRVAYLEVLLAPDNGLAAELGRRIGWDGKFENTLRNLKNNGIDDAVPAALKELKLAESEKNALLKCATPAALPGCEVAIRYIYEVDRAATPGQVFAQLTTGFALAARADSKVVAVGFSGPEDSLQSTQNYRLEMSMIGYMKSLHPGVHLTLAAGEIALALTPPEAIAFHIGEAVSKGRAERIVHGADIAHEADSASLLQQMQQRQLPVEICPSRSAAVLGSPPELAVYRKHDVPLVLASCDPGVLRTEISDEYLKAALDFGLGYRELKQMARNSLQFSFLGGASLWKNAKGAVPVAACARDLAGGKAISASCRNHLAASEKARQQWQLEQQFRVFENRR